MPLVHRAEHRRGAARPAADLPPPPHLSGDARQAFVEVVASRPGFFTLADSRLLCIYALACAELRRMEEDATTITSPTSYVRAVETVLKLARHLRLSPIARAENYQSAERPTFDPPPSPNGGAEDLVSHPVAPPWQRDAETASHRQSLS